MIAVKLCCLNIIEVGNSTPSSTKMRILVNSLPYSQIGNGGSSYICINLQNDVIELEWSRPDSLLKRQIPSQCIHASTLALTPFWLQFDADPHFVRVQLKMIILNKNKKSPQKKSPIKNKILQINTQNYEQLNSQFNNKNSAQSGIFCLESQRTLCDLENQRQKILQSLFSKINTTTQSI